MNPILNIQNLLYYNNFSHKKVKIITINWIYDNISDSNFVDEFWSICVEKGTVVGAVRTTLDNNTDKLEHEIRKN